jgi:hypothetical protein
MYTGAQTWMDTLERLEQVETGLKSGKWSVMGPRRAGSLTFARELAKPVVGFVGEQEIRRGGAGDY